MKAKLKVDGLAIGGSDSQLYYIYSSLDSNVQAMVLPFVRKAEKSNEWDVIGLIQHLERIFDDPNKVKKAGQRLRELDQRQTAVSKYVAKFERTLYEANADTWPDDAKITALTGGLNKEAKQRLNAQLNLPTKYNDFVRVLLTLEGQYDTRNDTRHTEQQGSNAMEWEKTTILQGKTAPAVNPAQRQEWRNQGKCVRCGSSSHWVQRCKYQPTQSRSPLPTAIKKTTARKTGLLVEESDLDDSDD
jgi:hypothetical protein